MRAVCFRSFKNMFLLWNRSSLDARPQLSDAFIWEMLIFENWILNTSITTLGKGPMLTQTSRLKWPQLYFITNVSSSFFPPLYSDCRAQASDTSESTHTGRRHTAFQPRVQPDISNVVKRNNSSTSLVQRHAQPVEEHACLMEELFAICLNSICTSH